MAKKGGISVSTENIFPVIKRWLYSDKDIFMRELVSNACDAITKHSRLVSLAQADEFSGEYRVDVAVSKKAKTIRISDNGTSSVRVRMMPPISRIGARTPMRCTMPII